MRRVVPIVAAVAAVACVALVARTSHAAPIPLNVDVSQRHLNESEETIAVNPTNPSNIVVVSNIGHREAGLTSGMFEGVSFDGGLTWTTKLIGLGAGDPLGDSCCDPSLSFDQYGNLWFTYLYETENVVPIALSTDGGLTFRLVTNIVAPPSGTPTKAPGDNRGLFRYVDQPTITSGAGEVWVIFNAGGPMFVTMTMLFGFVGLTAIASSDSFPTRWLASTFTGVRAAGPAPFATPGSTISPSPSARRARVIRPPSSK